MKPIKYRRTPYTISLNKQFVSRYNGSDFICKFEAVLPENFAGFTRLCVPFVIKECPSRYTNESIVRECYSYTNIVYNKITKQPYRNKEYARCWDEEEDNIDGYPRDVRKSVLASALFGATARPGFHVKPMHGLSYATIIPSGVGFVHRLKSNALFKPSG